MVGLISLLHYNKDPVRYICQTNVPKKSKDIDFLLSFSFNIDNSQNDEDETMFKLKQHNIKTLQNTDQVYVIPVIPTNSITIVDVKQKMLKKKLICNNHNRFKFSYK